MESQKPSPLDRILQGFQISGVFSKYPMLRLAFNALLDFAEECNVSPKDLTPLPAAQSGEAFSRIHWHNEFQRDVRSDESGNLGHYRCWRRLRLYRWIARTLGPIIGLVGFILAYYILAKGTFEVLGGVSWLTFAVITGMFFVLGFAAWKIYEVLQEKWPKYFQESPNIPISWEELVDIVRGELIRC